MRRFLPAGIAILFTAASFGAGSDPLTVAKIRFEIDGSLFEWTEDGPVPERGAGSGTAPRTLASFLDFHPGSILSGAELEARRSAAELRLKRSGFFYAASVEIVPPRRFPDRRTVLVSVTDGFRARFGGGNAYGFYGRVNAAGERKAWRLGAGYRYAEARYRDELLFGTDWTAEGYAGYGADDAFEAGLSLGRRLRPDAEAFLGLEGAVYDASRTALPAAGLRPGIVLSAARGPNEDRMVRAELRQEFPVSFLMDGGTRFFRTEGRYAAGLRRERWEAAAAASWALPLDRAAGAPVPEPFRRDLYGTADRSVRSGWTEDELTASSYALFSAELRFRAFRRTLAFPIALAAEPFAFVDAAILPDPPLRDAYGGGLRLIFDNPVFAYLSFAYGWNADGNGRFTLTGTAGY